MSEKSVPADSPLAALIAETLDAATLADGLVRKREDHAMTRPGFRDLYQYATNPLYLPGEGLLASLANDERLAGDFQRLLENVAHMRFPMVAAASSGQVERREIPGARMTFKASRADASQLYVILELEDASREPRVLFVREDGGGSERVILPRARNGHIQLLMETGSPLAARLRDIRSEIFLR